MDRGQVLLMGLPLFLLCSDLFTLFASKPSFPPPHRHRHHTQHHHQQATTPEPLEFPSQKLSAVGGIGFGSSVSIEFCSSCSYRGTALTMKKMLETQFPGIDVILANYPPPMPKRILGKLVPVVQFGVIGIILAGEHLFPVLGITVPPPWYYSVRANRFGTIASTWLLGNVVQSILQSSGAFEVYCNGEPVFSKLKEDRFPGEIELKDLVGQRLVNSRVSDGLGTVWS
ncbi:hypothetical protein MLD38_011521 [Melastoma candidum]|uniref:Uncharacterized protein n=1 Tax=Melastoma candidum TaxID=119954 RepID=A0ACB9R3C5_9MYRT|nr:hypothetical protein MLD38_011521 [Melastoma candidum]